MELERIKKDYEELQKKYNLLAKKYRSQQQSDFTYKRKTEESRSRLKVMIYELCELVTRISSEDEILDHIEYIKNKIKVTHI